MDKFIKLFARSFLVLGGAFLLLILITQVVLRYVFSAPIFGAEELARIVAMWIYFIGSAYALSSDEHICADIRDVIYIPSKLDSYINLFIALIVLIASLLISWFSTQYSWWVYDSKELTPGLWWPRYILVSAAAVGGILMSLIAAIKLISLTTAMIMKKDKN